MSIASPSLWNALNNSQYDAYNFPNAEAREKLFIFALLADLLKTFRLLARELAARPLEAPVLANFANALVMSIRFLFTVGALESVVISPCIAVASLGIFSIALVDDL